MPPHWKQTAKNTIKRVQAPLLGTPEHLDYDYHQAQNFIFPDEGGMRKYVQENSYTVQSLYEHIPTDAELQILYDFFSHYYREQKKSLRGKYRIIMGRSAPPTPTFFE